MKCASFFVGYIEDFTSVIKLCFYAYWVLVITLGILCLFFTLFFSTCSPFTNGDWWKFLCACVTTKNSDTIRIGSI